MSNEFGCVALASLFAGGFKLFHCYNGGVAAQQDTFLAADAAIGAASALIVYGSPSWAADPASTGFPWGSGPNYREGCIPWTQLDAWEDFILFTVERWHAPWGSGQPRISGHVIWNEIQSQVGRGVDGSDTACLPACATPVPLAGLGRPVACAA